MKRFSIDADAALLKVCSCYDEDGEIYTEDSVLESLGTDDFDDNMKRFIAMLENEEYAWYMCDFTILYDDGRVWGTNIKDSEPMFDITHDESLTTYSDGEYKLIPCNIEDSQPSLVTPTGVPTDGSEYGDPSYYHYSGSYGYSLVDKTFTISDYRNNGNLSKFYFIGYSSDGGIILKSEYEGCVIYTKYLTTVVPEFFKSAKDYCSTYYIDWVEYIGKYDSASKDAIDVAYKEMYSDDWKIASKAGLKFYKIQLKYNKENYTDFNEIKLLIL